MTVGSRPTFRSSSDTSVIVISSPTFALVPLSSAVASETVLSEAIETVVKLGACLSKDTPPSASLAKAAT